MKSDNDKFLQILNSTGMTNDEVASFVRKYDETCLSRLVSSLRMKDGLSQIDMSKKINVSQPTISAIEKKCNDQMKINDIKMYCDSLGYSIKLVITRDNISFEIPIN